MMYSLEPVKNLLVFSFQDSNWKTKYLIGSALILGGWFIPILPWLPVMGYGARILRRAAGGFELEEARLPKWDDWTDLMVDGLRQFGVSFILNLPVTLIILFGYGLYFGSVILMAATDGELGALFFFSFLVMWLTIGLSLPLGLMTMLFLAPAQAHVAVRKDFSAFLRGGEWFAVLRSNLGGFMVVLFFLLGFYILVMFTMQILYITIILCLLIPVIVSPLVFYIMTTYFHTTGIAYREGCSRLESAPGGDAVSPVAGPDLTAASPPDNQVVITG